MKAYTYRAVQNETGHIHKGLMSAANENELNHFLKQMGLELIEAKPRLPSAVDLFVQHLRKHAHLTDLMTLCVHLRDMLQSGVSFEEAFSLCTKTMQESAIRDALQQITLSIQSGSLVCAAFACHPRLFDPVFLSILDAGERAGDLAKTFDRLNSHLKWQAEVSHQIRRAIRYPLFLLALTMAVVTFMLSFVMPQLITFLLGLNQALPWSTQFLIKSADLFTQIWWALPLLLVGAITGSFIARRYSKRSSVWLDQCLLTIPLLGPVIRKLALVRMMTSLSLLVKSSLPLPDALQIAAHALGNRSLETQATQSHARLIAGAPLSQALAIILPPFTLQMLKIGEKSGTMPITLDRIAHSLETNAKESVDGFLGLLEPALTLLIGALMAWIVLAVLGPVYSSLAPLSQ